MSFKMKECYVYTLNNLQEMFFPSEKALNLEVDGVPGFLEKNFKKCFKNSAVRPGKFNPESEMRDLTQRYRQNELSFKDFADITAERLYELKDRHEQVTHTKLFVGAFQTGDVDQIDTVAVLEIFPKESMYLESDNRPDGVQVNLAIQSDTIPNATLANSSFFAINIETLMLSILEKPRSTEDDDFYLYADKLLACQTEPSVKEAVQAARVVAKEVVSKHQLDNLEMVPALERVIKETINEGKDLDFKEVAEEVFHQNPEAKLSYVTDIQLMGIKRPVLNSNHTKLPVKKMQKIKTDTGIEISIPLDYYSNKDYIEVKEAEDGRVLIQIKNVGAVENQ